MTKVLILGGDSDHNLGDAAIFEAMCHALQVADPGVEISAISSLRMPGSSPGLARVLAPGPAGFSTLMEAASRQDLIIIGGGGLFQDDDSRVKMPYWGLRTFLMGCANARVVGHSLGAGPLQHWESRLFARIACASMSSISVRDRFAHRWLARCTSKPVDVVPDPAFMLHPAPEQIADSIIADAGLPEGRVIGIALRKWFHSRGFLPHKLRVRLGLDNDSGATEMTRVIGELSLLVERLARTHDCGVLMMPSYDLAHEGDSAACQQVARNLHGRIPIGVASIRSAAEYKAVTGRLRLLVSARMHPLIFAVSMGTPVVGMAYNGKFDGMFEMLDMPHRLISLDEFRRGNPVPKIEQLIDEAIRDPVDYRQRARLLADTCLARTSALISDRMGAAVAPT